MSAPASPPQAPPARRAPAARAWVRLAWAVGLSLHLLTLGHHWRIAVRDSGGKDYASYHYAVIVAAEGGDPYDRIALSRAARTRGERNGGVHPFFYPPPFLAVMGWTRALSLVQAYRLWFWLDAAFVLAGVGAMARWWSRHGLAVPVALAAVLATWTAIPNNHEMGQFNAPVLLITLLGLRSVERGKDAVGGFWLGLACMLKMSPALLVAWCALRGRWRAVGASVVAAVALSAVALPWLGPAGQLRFYTEVLPTFSSGAYNGLTVGINLFGNHAIADWWYSLFPAGPRHYVLSGTARVLVGLTALAAVGGVAWAWRRSPADGFAEAAQAGGVMVIMLLLPAITYEHHLVWAVPAATLAVAGVASGRLRAGWAVPVGLAFGVLAYDLAWLKTTFLDLQRDGSWLALPVREAKSVGLLVLAAAMVQLGRSAPLHPEVPDAER